MTKEKRDSATPMRRTKEEGQALVEHWRQSGLSARAYGRIHGVPPHVVHYWAGKIAKKKNQEDFFVVPLEPESKPQTEDVLEFELDRKFIRVPASMSREVLAQVLRAMGGGQP